MTKRTYHDNHPLGRKHGSGCGRWRLVIEFSVRRWTDLSNTVPLTFSSRCRGCDAARRRAVTGYKPRDWYRHGAPGTAGYRDHVNRRNRATAKKRREDPEYRRQEEEYRRIWAISTGRQLTTRQTLPTQGASGRPEERIDPLPFLDWYDARDDVRVTDTERRQVRAARERPGEGIRLRLVDAIMTRYGAQHLFSLMYPLDGAQAA
jgi:hypothetical protein